MASWQDFEDVEPEMAEAGKKLLYQFGPGLAFLATIRKDGGPRLHPICPTMVNGRLYALILANTYKFGDLRRDGRYALHTFPPVENDDEFLVMGRAAVINDDAVATAIRDDQVARGMTTTDNEVAVEFRIERVMWAKYPGGHGTFPPRYTVWLA
jgi:Pyridoxamine 5'-phosphate oxidase